MYHVTAYLFMASTKKNEVGIKQSTLLKWEINATSESLYLKMFLYNLCKIPNLGEKRS